MIFSHFYTVDHLSVDIFIINVFNTLTRMRATILLGIVLAVAATASAGFIRIGFLNNANQVDECGQKCENSFALHTTEKV